MNKKKQNKNWNGLDFETKCWVYKHYCSYIKYKTCRTFLTKILDWFFGSPYSLEETMIEYYGENNIRNFEYE